MKKAVDFGSSSSHGLLGGGAKHRLEIEETDFDSLLRHRAKMPRMVQMPPPKTTLAAVGMLCVGSAFIIMGVHFSWSRLLGKNVESNSKDDASRGFAMVCLGLLMFIPGSYASTILWGAYRGWPGYHYDHLPSYDED